MLFFACTVGKIKIWVFGDTQNANLENAQKRL